MAVPTDKRASELTAPVSIADTDVFAGYRPGTGGEPNLDIRASAGLIRAPITAGLATGAVTVAASAVMTPADASGPGSVAESAAEQALNASVSAMSFIPLPLRAAIRAGTSADDVVTYLQAAIDSGKSFTLPYGTFCISADLDFRGRVGQVYRGAGRRKTTIKRINNTGPILRIDGTSAVFQDFELVYATASTTSDTAAHGIKLTSGASTVKCRFNNIHVKNAYDSINVDGAITLANTWDDLDLNGFANAAWNPGTTGTGTGSRWDRVYIQNKPRGLLTGTLSGTVSTTGGNVAAGTGASMAVGQRVYISAGTGSGQQAYITNISTDTLTWAPALNVAPVVGSSYHVDLIDTCSAYPFRLLNQTDGSIGVIAIEWCQLPSGVVSPFQFESCDTLFVESMRAEEIIYRAATSALVCSNGRSNVVIAAMQSNYSAMLTAFGCTTWYAGRVFNQATIDFLNIQLRDMYVTSAVKWAHSTGSTRTEAPYGGVWVRKFNLDATIAPGTYDQTAAGANGERALRQLGDNPGGWAVVLTPVAGAVTPDVSKGRVFMITLNANLTIAAPINAIGDEMLTFIIRQDASVGTYTVAWTGYTKSWSDSGAAVNKFSSVQFWVRNPASSFVQIGAQSPYV